MTPTRRSVTFGALAGGALAGTSLAVTGGGLARAAASVIADPQTVGPAGIDVGAMDRAVTPGEDFYRYVSGTWLKTTPIPSDRGRWVEFSRLDNLNADRNRAILETAAASPASTEAKKLGDFYASLMDEAGIEAKGTAPLQAELAKVAAIATPADLARALAQLSRDWLQPLPGGGSPMPPAPIAAGVSIDAKRPSRYLPSLDQGGLGLPDRDYFLVDANAGFVKARAAYKTHLAAMFRLAGLSEPEARAGRVYALEERIARTHWTREASRDADKRYNLWTRAEFATKAPGLDWTAFLSAAGFDGQDTFLIAAPSAITGAAEVAGSAPLSDWRDYIAYRVIRAFAPAGPRAFVAENFAYEDKALQGTPEAPVRWKRAGQIMDRAMRDAVGRIYLATYFPPAARAQAELMTAQIKAAMGRRIQALSWMAPQTKARALAKLAAVRIEVGGQTPLRTYDALQVSRTDAYGNVLRAARVSYARSIDRLGKPVDRGEWQMAPQTVNAQSNTLLTKIMFPAGIMQGLFFNPDADPAVNYGAIGVVMGHELSHQFDDQGAKYDEHGALDNWWTADDLKSFTTATEALAKQYDGYEPLPGQHINGHLTLGENLADLAGLSLARDAYHASLGGKPAPVIGGFTADQRFFLAYSALYRSLAREDYMRQALATDPHSPGEWRAAEVRNLDAWYAAFNVQPGQRMYLPPEQRVRVW
jgi:putative endopeptidase